MDEGCLSNLRFADDVVLFLDSIAEVEAMPVELKAEKRIGLRLNRKKCSSRRAFTETEKELNALASMLSTH